MSVSLNRVILIGHLDDNPEIKITDDGKEIASLTVVTSGAWNDKVIGEKKQATQVHRVIVLNELLIATLKSYCEKGTRVLLEGSLRTRKWQDQDKNDRFITEIIIPNPGGKLLLLDSVFKNNQDVLIETSVSKRNGNDNDINLKEDTT